MLLCGRENITYQLGSGVTYECNGELLHSKAVLKRRQTDERSIFIMRSLALKDELYGLCSFATSLSGSSSTPLKMAGNISEMQDRLPGLIAEHKVRRLVFDEEELFSLFQKPGLGRITKLVPFVDDGHRSFSKIIYPASSARASRAASTSSSTSESGCLPVIVFAAIIIVIILVLRSC